MKKLFNLVVVLMVMLALVACDDKDDNKNNVDPLEPITTEGTPLKLWYDEEAPKIDECAPKGYMLSWGEQGMNDDGWTNWSLPIGNGYFGVNVFGRTESERITISDKTLTTPWQYPTDYDNQVGGLNTFSETYLDFNHTNTNVSNYERYLDIKTAISGVKYDYEGVTYTREYITSYPDKSLVIYLDSSEKGALDFTLRPTVPYEKEYLLSKGDGFSKDGQVESWVEGDTGVIELTGNMGYYGIDFMATYKVYIEDGTMEASEVYEEISENWDGGSHSEVGDGIIEVSGATRAYIVVTLGTDYELESGIFLGGQFDRNKPTQKANIEDVREKVEADMNKVEELTYDLDVKGAYSLLRERHVEDYQKLFNRVSLDLGYDPDDLEVTTDVLQFRGTLGMESTYLQSLIFQYGRYLLISSSRPGTLPAHLQGAWNCYDTPPWSSGYWHNINVQMNYWPAFTTNLAETFEAYVDFNKAYMEQAQYNANYEISTNNPEVYGQDGGNGWTVGVAGDAFFINSDPSSGNMGFTTPLFWDQYLYTMDEEVLEYTYEILADAARYITKAVKEDEYGNLLVDYCDSPEQFVNGSWYFTTGTTYAQSLSYVNNYYTLLAAKEMGIDLENETLLSQEEYSILKTVMYQLDKYDPIVIGLSGQVKEFREEEYYSDLGDPSHRHISHLVGLYPGTLINSSTPAWMDAASVALDGRSGYKETYGWPYAHKVNLYARLKDGENAYNNLKNYIKRSNGTNLWSIYDEIFQYDANSGITAGIGEMLLQSQEGFIEPLAAIPNAWAKGSYTGLAARGNFVVDCSWENGVSTKIVITSNAGGTAKIKYPSITGCKVVDSKGNEVSYSVSDTDVISFETTKGETYYLTGFKKVERPDAVTNFDYTREGLGEYNFTWDSVKGATEYRVYKAVESAATYTLIGTTTDTCFAYTPSDSEFNLRTTFVVTAVNGNGVESKRSLCYSNPIEIYEEAEVVSWNVTSSNGLEIVLEPNEDVLKYKLYEKTAIATDYVLVAEAEGSILSAPTYNKDSVYAISTISKYDMESELKVLDKNYNILKGKKFIPTTTANNCVFPSWGGYVFGYDNLTDGVFDENIGRFSTNNNNSHFDASIALGGKYTVNELRLYDYAHNYAYAGTDLKVEAYLNGQVVKETTLTSNAEYAAHRVNVNDPKAYSYLSFDLGGVEADSVKIYISNTTTGYSISFYEIEVLGYSEIPTNGATNVFKGKEFVPTTAANNCIFPSWGGYVFGYDNLTDGVIDEFVGRFSTDTTNSFVDGTINLGESYSLQELRIYDYNQDINYMGTDLKIEVYSNGAWKTVVNCSSNQEIASHRSGNYLSFDLNNENAEQVRITVSNTINGYSVSIYEIECYGIK